MGKWKKNEIPKWEKHMRKGFDDYYYDVSNFRWWVNWMAGKSSIDRKSNKIWIIFYYSLAMN